MNEAASGRRIANLSRRTRFAITIAASVLPVPVLVQLMQSGLFEPAIAPGAWLHEPVLDALHAFLGLPALASLWLLPVLLGALAWALPAGLERLAARVDPDDRAWTSFAWALRSWRGALRWLAIVVLPTAALVAARLGIWKADLPVVSEWLNGDMQELFDLLWLSVPFFVLVKRNLVSDEPPRRWSARWPTRQVWLLLGSLFAVAGLVSLQVDSSDVRRWLGTEWRTTRFITRFAALWLGSWLVSIPLTWMVDLAWLSRAGWTHLPAVWRRGLRLRVLALRAVQYARPALYLVTALLPIVAWGWFFVRVVPLAEDTLRDHGYACCSACCAMGGFWPPMVAASRHLVAWWWIYTIVASGAIWFAAKALWRWFGDVAWARLMVETGVVDAEAATGTVPMPATRPDCDPATTIPPTA